MISDKTLKRVANYTDEEVNRALDDWDRKEPMKPIREELGGDYYFKCPWLSCGKVVKYEDNFCPSCGTRFDWS